MLSGRGTARRGFDLLARAVSAIGILAAPVAAQPVAECVRGDPRIPPAIESHPDGPDRLARLAWRQSHADYLTVLAAVGAAAVLDTLANRTREMLAVVGPQPPSFVDDTTLLFRRLRDMRGALPATAGLQPVPVDRIPPFAHLRPAPDLTNPDLVIFTGSEPGRVTLRFDPSNPVPAIAICAAYHGAYLFLDNLQAPALRETAERYARLSRRWDEYVERGYSLTLVERLGHSCRLGPLNWIVATATARRCGDSALPPLGPPRIRTIFAHPTAGLAPILADSSSFVSGAVMEWYGVLAHRYPDGERMQTYGVSLATAYPDAGPRRLGVVVHLSEIPLVGIPLPKVGIFENRGGSSSWRGRVFLTADVVGWVPGVRAAAQEVAVQPVVRHLVAIARARMGG